MSFIFLRRLGAIAAAILLPATLHAALPTPAEAPERSFLTGQLLIASPSMGDPRFLQTVILMVQHDENGAPGKMCERQKRADRHADCRCQHDSGKAHTK